VGTRDRAVDEALRCFATRGYEATSLDDLAARLGVTKQAILHHFGSKEQLLNAAVDRAADDLTAVFAVRPPGRPRRAAGAESPFAMVEATVRSAFALAARRPETLGLIREVGRLGPPASERMAQRMQPLMDRAEQHLDEAVRRGWFRPVDTRVLLVTAYGAVVGIFTEPAIIAALGVEPTVRSLVRGRRQVIDLLRGVLEW
jgi:AcrR family transcriptional regulator